MQLSSIAKQSAIYLIGDAARRMVAVVMLPLYTRYLMPAEYGMVELIDLFVMVSTMTVGVLAISDSMIRLYHSDGGEEGTGKRVVSTSLWSCAVLSAVVLALALPSAGLISKLLFHTPQHAYLLRGAFVAVFFGNLAELGFVYQRMRQRALLFVSLSLAQLLLNVGFNVWFIAFRGAGVWGFVLAKLISAAVAAIINVYVLTRAVGFTFCWEKAVSIVKFGGPLIISSVSIFVIHFSDRFFLSWYSTLTQVGLYALAYKIGFLVTYMVGEPFGRVWTVTLYKYVSQPGWQREFARVLRYLAFALAGAALGVSIFSPEGLMMITTSTYEAAAALVPPIAFGYALREGGDFFRGVLFINKRTRTFGAITLCCAVANVALNFWMIPVWGPAGAARATFLTWLLYLAICWRVSRNEHQIPYPIGHFVRLFALAAVALLLAQQIPAGRLLLATFLKAGLLAGFVAALVLSGYFSPSDVRQVRVYLVRRYQALTTPLSRMYSS